ncbi:MAG TPA: hypothetical protein VGM81_22255 [Burkholderiaceae bacterium]|jgi:hypothetical protein
MQIFPLTRRSDGTASATSKYPTVWERVQTDHLAKIFGGQQVYAGDVGASPPDGYAVWQTRDGRLYAFNVNDGK